MRCRAGVFVLTALAPLWAASAHAEPAGGRELTLAATPMALNPRDESIAVNRRLAYRGGLVITSADDDFGGLSGLVVSADGATALAVSDAGHWVTFGLTYDAGRLTGVGDGRIAPLRDPNGRPLDGGKTLGDAEGLARLADGTYAVSFERRHRVWRYDVAAEGFDARPRTIRTPPALEEATNNAGLEAIAQLPGGDLLAITEGTFDADDNLAGWRISAKNDRPLALRHDRPFNLTDMALLPTGGVLTLERRYSPIGGVGAQMRLIPAAELDGNGPLDGEIVYRSTAGETVDNMEGLAVRRGEDGETLVYAVSDDNFNPLQRTILMMFALDLSE